MRVHLVGLNLFRLHQPGHQRMILGESYKFAIAQQVGAAIADVSNVGRFVLYQSGSNSASESTGSGMLFTMPQDGFIRVLDRLSKLALNCQRHRRIRQLTRLLWLHNFGGSYLFYGFQFNRRISQFKQVEFDGWLLINRDEEAPQPFADLLYGKLTGHFASLVAAHTVSHDKETTVPILRLFNAFISRVFVLFSLFSSISFISSSKFK